MNLQGRAQYERFEAYGFRIDYPSDCIIEFNPKSTRTEGDVALKSPRGYKLFLSWGPLEKVKKLDGVDGHADYSVQRVKGSREAEIREIGKDSLLINGHGASFRDVKLELVRRGVFFNKTKVPQEVRSFHVHCDPSSRYFVIYGPVVPEKGEEQREVLSAMAKSFVCHEG